MKQSRRIRQTGLSAGLLAILVTLLLGLAVRPAQAQSTGSITIVKEATPQSEQEFSFRTNIGGINTQFTLKDNGIDPNFKSFDNLAPSVYAIEEFRQAGWKFKDVQCEGGSDIVIGGSAISITLQAGENVTCTFTNEKVGSITIVKDANPDDGTAFEFDQDIDASGSFSLTDGDSKTFSDVAPATYKISETVPSDWYMSLVQCEAASGNDVNFNIDYVNDYFNVELESGEDVTCTVSNKLFATLTIKKETVGGDDTFNFTSLFFPVASFDLTTVGGTAQRTFGELPSNLTYEVKETPQAGWVLTDASCDNGDTPDAVFLAPGDNVTCTFVNVREAPAICPAESPYVGTSTTRIIGIGMYPNQGATAVIKDPQQVTGLYAQLAGKKLPKSTYTRAQFIPKLGATNLATVNDNVVDSAQYRDYAVFWYGTALDAYVNKPNPAQNADRVFGRLFVTSGSATNMSRALILYPDYRTAGEYFNYASVRESDPAARLALSNKNHVYWQTSAGWIQKQTYEIQLDGPLPDKWPLQVQAAVVDNDPDKRPVWLTIDLVDGGGNVLATKVFKPVNPTNGNMLNIYRPVFEAPEGTVNVILTLQSPNLTGDSAALVGATVNYPCAIDVR